MRKATTFHLPSVVRLMVVSLLASFLVIAPLSQTDGAQAVPISCSDLSGSGESADPFLVTTSEHLDKVVQCPDGSFYRLTQDIVRTSLSPIIATFSGTLDGNNKKITGISISASADIAGLFATVTNATFINLVIESAVIDGGSNNFVGALAAKAVGVTLSNVTGRNLQISGETFVGGLFGEVSGDASLSNVSISNALITGGGGTSIAYVGGLMGNVEGNASFSGVLAT
jgi:hypothetical protein